MSDNTEKDNKIRRQAAKVAFNKGYICALEAFKKVMKKADITEMLITIEQINKAIIIEKEISTYLKGDGNGE